MMNTIDKPVIAVLVSTTRHARVGRQLAEALLASVPDDFAATVELVDLAEVDLPWLDEPQPPSAGNYQMPTTRAWARRVLSWDAVVILSAQYNGGYPAPLKNAIDTVCAEWANKPTLIATYGGHRSGGGRSAAEQLSIVFQVTRNRVVEQGIALELDATDYGPDLRLVDPNAIIARNQEHIRGALAALTDAIDDARRGSQHD